MQALSIDKQILIALNEIFDKRRFCAISFAVIAMVVVSIGLKWPNTYESSATLLWNKSQIVKPLLEGTAVIDSGSEQTRIAKEIMYGNKNLETLIKKTELDFNADRTPMSERELEVLKSELRSKIMIKRKGDDILKISYRSSSAEQAYLVVSTAISLFLEEVTQNKKEDNYAAYDFIELQVNQYKAKLDAINKEINDFKTKNVELGVESFRGVNNRIDRLKEQIKSTSLKLKEANIQRDSLVEQLLIESQKSNADEIVNVRNERLVELENRLNTLRASYTETYPDIVQIKEQIKFLKADLEKGIENQKHKSDAENSADTGNPSSALYIRLKQQLADQQTLIKTLEARKLDQEKQFAEEVAASSEVSLAVSKLEQLSRDRNVTKKLYDSLLTQRENARVSLSLELVSGGSVFKIQEPPVIPLVPIGLRFLHFAIGSVVLGIGIPLGAIIGLLLIDPRIRHEDALHLADEIPVIGVISIFKTKGERRKQRIVTAQAFVIVTFSLAMVVTLSLSRYYEVI